MRNEAYPEETIGRMMDPPLAVFRPETTIAEATADLRSWRTGFRDLPVGGGRRGALLGVVVMREMLLGDGPSRRWRKS